jgi:hypothetical protein
MNDVATDLSDYYNIPFFIANSNIENCRLTSTINNLSFDEVKYILEKALEAKLIVLDDKIVIHGEGCSN